MARRARRLAPGRRGRRRAVRRDHQFMPKRVQVDEARRGSSDAIHVSGPAGRVEGGAPASVHRQGGNAAQLDLDRVEVVLSGGCRAADGGNPPPRARRSRPRSNLPTERGGAHRRAAHQGRGGERVAVALAPAAGSVNGPVPRSPSDQLSPPRGADVAHSQGPTAVHRGTTRVDGVVELELDDDLRAAFDGNAHSLAPGHQAAGRACVDRWRAPRRPGGGGGPCSEAGIHVGTALLRGGLAHPRRRCATGGLLLEKVQLEGTGSRLEATATVDLNASTLERCRARARWTWG